MPKQEKAQTIESLKFSAKETNYKWGIAMTFIVSSILGIVGGWFLATTMIHDTQSKVVNSIQLSVSK